MSGCIYCGYSFGVRYNICDSCQVMQDTTMHMSHVYAFRLEKMDIEIAELKAKSL